MSESVQGLASAIENHLKTASPKKAALNHGLTLLISIFLFISLGLFNGSFSSIFIVAVVILIHELGHYVGMRIFGYQNVHILFIPLFGAFTSGKVIQPNATRKAIVSLLGPLPGIIIGTVFWILHFKTQNEFFVQPARIFLFLNAFNLLPFPPLDGGHFVEDVLFSKSPKLEATFKLLSCLAFGFMAFAMKSPLLGLIAFLTLITVKPNHDIAKLAQKIKQDSPPDPQITYQQIPPATYIETMLDVLHRKERFRNLKLSKKAEHIQGFWNRVSNKPPSFAAGFGLLVLYGIFLVFSLAAPLTLEGLNFALQSDKKIETVRLEDGTEAKVQSTYLKDRLFHRVMIDEEGFYHGTDESFNPTTFALHKRGRWYRGKWDGEWMEYDKAGKVIWITTFDKGHFILMKELKGDKWVEKSFNQMPKWFQKICKSHEQGPPSKIKSLELERK